MRIVVTSVEKASTLVARMLGLISIMFLSIIVLLTTADVIARYFGAPIPGTFEVVELLLVTVVLFSFAYTAVQRRHVAMTVLFSRFSPRVQAIITIFTSSLAVIGLFFIVYGGFLEFIRAWQQPSLEVTDVLRIPIFSSKIVVPLGIVALCLVLLSQWLRTLGQLSKQ